MSDCKPCAKSKAVAQTSCGCSSSSGLPLLGCNSTSSQQPHVTPSDDNCACPKYVKNLIQFVMPACGSKAEVMVENATAIAPGAELYAPGVGFLTVDSVKDDTIIVVKNYCKDNPGLPAFKSPGQPIDAETKFTIGVPSSGSSTGNYYSASGAPFLASDFFIPAADECVLVAVTSIEGLSPEQRVSIASNTYTLSEIVDGTTIKICNANGTAGPAGTLVKAQDDCETYNYPIVVVSQQRACDEEPVTAGSLIVCVNGVEAPLKGGDADGVVKWDAEERNFTVMPTELEDVTDCTLLTACFTLDPEQDPQEYLVTVENSAIFSDPKFDAFQPNLTIKISGKTFTVKEVVDSTHIRIEPSFDVEAIEVIGDCDGEPVSVCVASCCELSKDALEKVGDIFIELAPTVVETDVPITAQGTHVFSADISTNLFPTLATLPELQDLPDDALVQVFLEVGFVPRVYVKDGDGEVLPESPHFPIYHEYQLYFGTDLTNNVSRFGLTTGAGGYGYTYNTSYGISNAQVLPQIVSQDQIDPANAATPGGNAIQFMLTANVGSILGFKKYTAGQDAEVAKLRYKAVCQGYTSAPTYVNIVPPVNDEAVFDKLYTRIKGYVKVQKKLG